MSSNKSQKWSSSSSLSKIISRISRTLSFSSKKSQQTLKNNNKKIAPVIKNVNFVPQSAPVIRRHPPQSISKILYVENYHREQIHVESDIEEDNYSLRPNLSLFNISTENLNYQQYDWLDDVLHSTKIEDH